MWTELWIPAVFLPSTVWCLLLQAWKCDSSVQYQSQWGMSSVTVTYPPAADRVCFCTALCGGSGPHLRGKRNIPSKQAHSLTFQEVSLQTAARASGPCSNKPLCLNNNTLVFSAVRNRTREQESKRTGSAVDSWTRTYSHAPLVVSVRDVRY